MPSYDESSERRWWFFGVTGDVMPVFEFKLDCYTFPS